MDHKFYCDHFRGITVEKTSSRSDFRGKKVQVVFENFLILATIFQNDFLKVLKIASYKCKLHLS